MRIMSKRAATAVTALISHLNHSISNNNNNIHNNISNSFFHQTTSKFTSISHTSTSTSTSKRIPLCCFLLSTNKNGNDHRNQKRHYNKSPNNRNHVIGSSSSISSSISSLQMQNRNIIDFDSLPSTQDEARKRLLQEDNTNTNTNNNNNTDTNNTNNKKYIAITTTMQTKGRGTNSRTWIGKKGNTFLTLTIPQNDLTIPITLLPLQIGIIIAQQIQRIIQNNDTTNNTNSIGGTGGTGSTGTSTSSKVSVKWPNDVLVNGKKIAGVLIESEQDKNGDYYFLIGIGINYKYAPSVSSIGPERGRETTCICDHVTSEACNNVGNDNDVNVSNDNNEGNCDTDEEGINKAKDLGTSIANDVWDWVKLQKNWDGAGEAIVRNFEYWTDFGQELTLRDIPGNEVVIPISIEKDGRLKVRSKYGGEERLLCADYLL